MSRIAFFGSSTYSVNILLRLSEARYEIVVAVTQPPKPVGRKGIVTPTPIADFAKSHAIPILTPKSSAKDYLEMADEEGFIAELKKYHPDLLIVVAFGLKIPHQALEQAKHGGLNVHPSLLPKYRGAAPVQWAILKGEKETGVTIIKMADEIDAGEILAQKREPIFPTNTSETLYPRLFDKGTHLLLQVLPDYLAGRIRLQKQDPSLASYYPRLTRQDGFVPWEVLQTAMKGENITWQSNITRVLSQNSKFIERMLRAFSPWPGVWTKVRIKNYESRIMEMRLKILEAHLDGEQLIIDKVQLEGKKPLTWEEFLRGHPDVQGR